MEPTIKSILRILTVCLCASAMACGAEPKSRVFRVDVRVESDPGEALPNVQLSSSDEPLLGRTDDAGLAQLSLTGAPGERLQVRIACPEGYRSAEPVNVSLRTWLEAERAPEYRRTCAPRKRRMVVAVRTDGAPSLPLRHLGREIARTSSFGAGHALLSAEPGDTLRLSLDTSAAEHAWLRPRSPELKLTVPDRDEVVVFEQTFTREKTRRPRSRRRRTRGPVRL